jgi:hypothetical protein
MEAEDCVLAMALNFEDRLVPRRRTDQERAFNSFAEGLVPPQVNEHPKFPGGPSLRASVVDSQSYGVMARNGHLDRCQRPVWEASLHEHMHFIVSAICDPGAFLDVAVAGGKIRHENDHRKASHAVG